MALSLGRLTLQTISNLLFKLANFLFVRCDQRQLSGPHLIRTALPLLQDKLVSCLLRLLKASLELFHPRERHLHLVFVLLLLEPQAFHHLGNTLVALHKAVYTSSLSGCDFSYAIFQTCTTLFHSQEAYLHVLCHVLHVHAHSLEIPALCLKALLPRVCPICRFTALIMDHAREVRLECLSLLHDSVDVKDVLVLQSLALRPLGIELLSELLDDRRVYDQLLPTAVALFIQQVSQTRELLLEALERHVSLLALTLH
mmetsp:Transcript_132053/g.232599  ORF Transcript_132053/g.232599 Transcript_132053/m.232599 type:complete len:256 (-) Transcript_132053:558-1325(-)